MVPTAVSQLAEQVVNAIVSIGAAMIFVKMGAKVDKILGTTTASAAYGAGGSTLGTTMGALAGLLFLVFVYVTGRRRTARRVKADRDEAPGEQRRDHEGAHPHHHPGGAEYRHLQHQRHHRPGRLQGVKPRYGRHQLGGEHLLGYLSPASSRR